MFQAGDRVKYKDGQTLAFGPPDRRGKFATVKDTPSDGTPLEWVAVQFDGEEKTLAAQRASIFEKVG